MRRPRLVDGVLLAVLWLTQAGAPQPVISPYAILAAEDARAILPAQFDTLVQGTKDPSPEVQRIAVRALGRLEREAAIAPLLAALSAPSASVRAQAADALAQSLTNGGTDPNQQVARVDSALKAALEKETDPQVRGTILQSVGRLPFTTAMDRERVACELAAHLTM